MVFSGGDIYSKSSRKFAPLFRVFSASFHHLVFILGGTAGSLGGLYACRCKISSYRNLSEKKWVFPRLLGCGFESFLGRSGVREQY
jgi:hypothetical protein